jgi:hypothetical protein
MENIWDKFNFENRTGKSAYDYLVDTKSSLVAATGGELTLEICVTDAVIDNNYLSVYKLYVMSPRLGYYRRHYITVQDYSNNNHFPVDVYDLINQEWIKHVKEKNFLQVISDILSKNAVKRSIQNLYKQSKEMSALK